MVGFVHITADPHSRNKINDELMKIPEIKELYFSRGEEYNSVAYDFIGKVEINGKDEFQKIVEVLKEIRKIEDVINTWTLKRVTRGLENYYKKGK